MTPYIFHFISEASASLAVTGKWFLSYVFFRFDSGHRR
nr:MAG TPA: hypothetical protein [Caudoviricetes sp.]